MITDKRRYGISEIWEIDYQEGQNQHFELDHQLVYAKVIDLYNDHNSKYKNDHILTFLNNNFPCSESSFIFEEIKMMINYNQ